MANLLFVTQHRNMPFEILITHKFYCLFGGGERNYIFSNYSKFRMIVLKKHIWLIVFRNLNAFFIFWSIYSILTPIHYFVTFNVLHEHKNDIFGGGDKKSHTVIHIGIFLGKLLVYKLVLSFSLQFKLFLLLNLVYHD